ncbi:MAG: DUF3782 domain-containing protein [Synechococcaceae cyanobacterium SM1_2_3]|nr:DUF3782 domain-containing protein [Synechococcaceae cyanobacterium SM1_2_3]
MTVEDLRTRLQTELPELLKQDSGFRRWLEQLIRQTAITPESFDACFDRMLQAFAADREEHKREWAKHLREWDEHLRESRESREEQNRKWEESRVEQNRKWEENKKLWWEQNRLWWKQNRKNDELLEQIKLSCSKQEQSIGALGARWGTAFEQSFRPALKGILETSFGVEVLNVNEFDDEGSVFGRPDQVEIDIFIKNGEVILCELKSSMSKGDMYIFDRKASFYQQRHQRPVQRKIVISPMTPPSARAVAEKLGIAVFSYAEDASGL